MKLRELEDGKLMFYCRGCGTNHYFDSRWTFNEDYEKPTFSPSLLVEIGHYPNPNDICHSFVTDGKMQYLNDCTHSLAGKTVEMLDENNWFED